MWLKKEKDARCLIAIDLSGRPVWLRIGSYFLLQLHDRLLDIDEEVPESSMGSVINNVTDATIHEDD